MSNICDRCEKHPAIWEIKHRDDEWLVMAVVCGKCLNTELRYYTSVSPEGLDVKRIKEATNA